MTYFNNDLIIQVREKMENGYKKKYICFYKLDLKIWVKKYLYILIKCLSLTCSYVSMYDTHKNDIFTKCNDLTLFNDNHTFNF